MEMKTYVVTDLSGPYICGRRVKAGARIRLTDRQAKYELDRFLIRPATSEDLVPDAKPQATAPSVAQKS